MTTHQRVFRLSPGNEVRLKGAYIIKANKVIYNKEGFVDEVECTYDPKSKSGSGSEESKRKVKGTLHWVSSTKNIHITIREYDRLFEHPSPGQFPPEEFYKILNPNSMSVSTAHAELENVQGQNRRIIPVSKKRVLHYGQGFVHEKHDF